MGDYSMTRALVSITLAVICLVAAVTKGTQAGELLKVEGEIVKWGSSTLGGRTVLTYAMLSAPYAVPGDKHVLSPSNCGAMRPFADIVALSSGITDATARRELRSAFTEWEQAANIKFIEVGDARVADIIIGAAAVAEGRAFANLSYRRGNVTTPAVNGVGGKALGGSGLNRTANSFPKGGNEAVATIEQAYVCLNPQARWKSGFDGNLDVYDLRYTFAHEIGHAIGLDHPDSTGSVMAYRYDERVDRCSPEQL